MVALILAYASYKPWWVKTIYKYMILTLKCTNRTKSLLRSSGGRTNPSPLWLKNHNLVVLNFHIWNLLAKISMLHQLTHLLSCIIFYTYSNGLKYLKRWNKLQKSTVFLFSFYAFYTLGHSASWCRVFWWEGFCRLTRWVEKSNLWRRTAMGL